MIYILHFCYKMQINHICRCSVRVGQKMFMSKDPHVFNMMLIIPGPRCYGEKENDHFCRTRNTNYTQTDVFYGDEDGLIPTVCPCGRRPCHSPYLNTDTSCAATGFRVQRHGTMYRNLKLSLTESEVELRKDEVEFNEAFVRDSFHTYTPLSDADVQKAVLAVQGGTCDRRLRKCPFGGFLATGFHLADFRCSSTCD